MPASPPIGRALFRSTIALQGTEMADTREYKELIEYLQHEGHSAADIEKILARVRQYEFETQHDSIMDSIGGGTFDLAALIKEALDGNGQDD
jgi:hypothetical protein